MLVPAQMQMLPGGNYQIGVRANHVYLQPQSPQDVALPSSVALAEISGSETFLHVDHGDTSGQRLRLVAQLAGVHSIAYGEQTTVYLDPNRLYAFDRTGKLVAAPTRSTSMQADEGNAAHG